MALLQWLKKEGFGSYATVEEFQGELGRRSTQALGALGAALAAIPADLHEAAEGAGQGICADVARDLRVPKGSRIAAVRALLLAGAGAQLAKVFAGGFDLHADPRLPEADRAYLSKNGLKAFLQSIAPDVVNVEVLRGAAAAETAVKAVGADAVRDVLDEFPAGHTAAITVRHAALGGPLPPDLEARWLEVLGRQYRAAKNAPPAAKRLGTAPEWPPVIPEVFRPLLPKAESAPATPKAPNAPPTPPPAPLSPTTPEGDLKRIMPALRPRPRGAPEEGTFNADAVAVAPAALQSAPAPATRELALRHMRFGPEVELLATRGTRAIERFLAAIDVRAARIGADRALAELDHAADKRGAKEVNEPILDELFAIVTDPKAALNWRRAARVVLEHLSPDRHAALPPEVSPQEMMRQKLSASTLNRPPR